MLSRVELKLSENLCVRFRTLAIERENNSVGTKKIKIYI